MASNERSAEWLRGAVAALFRMIDDSYQLNVVEQIGQKSLREATQPTAAECELSGYHLDQECEGQPKSPTAAEVIEACEKALGTAECYLCIYENEQRHRNNWEGSEDQGILQTDKEANVVALALCDIWKESNGGPAQTKTT